MSRARALQLVRLTRTEFLMSAVAILGIGMVALIVFVWATESSRMGTARNELADVRGQMLQQAAMTESTAEVVATKSAVEVPVADTGAADVEAAQTLFKTKGCTACHMAPGIPEATGTVGPNLAGLASRVQIAGTLDLNAENLARWLENPPDEKAGTLMPQVGLSEADVQTLVGWLLTLK